MCRELDLEFDLKNIFKSKIKFTESKYLTFKPKDEQYIIDEIEIELDLKNRISIISFIAIGIILVYAISKYQSFSDLESFISVAILGGLIIFYLIYLEIVRRKFGVIRAVINNLETDSKYFKVKIINEKEWKNVRKIQIMYSLIEEIEDNRGTTTQKHKEELFRSKSFKIQNLKTPIEVEFEFPEEAYRSKKIGDVKLFWLLELRLKPFLGPNCKYENEFNVR